MARQSKLSDPAQLRPLAGEDEPEYIPTVDVLRVVRAWFVPDYIRRRAVINGLGVIDDPLENAMAIEDACREILDANRWLLPELCMS